MLQKYIENKNKTNEQASTKKKKKIQTYSQQLVPGWLPKTIIILLVLFVRQTSSS